MKRTIPALAVSLLLAACATAATTIGFPAADADDNESLTRKEFDEFWDDTNLFERFDDDDDRALSLKEFQEAVDSEYEAHFTHFDINKNNSLSASEMTCGWYDLFDADKSGTLSRGEFEKSIAGLEVEI